jgi:hypothetical protein
LRQIMQSRPKGSGSAPSGALTPQGSLRHCQLATAAYCA